VMSRITPPRSSTRAISESAFKIDVIARPGISCRESRCLA
jgi:hypothetical protein